MILTEQAASIILKEKKVIHFDINPNTDLTRFMSTKVTALLYYSWTIVVLELLSIVITYKAII